MNETRDHDVARRVFDGLFHGDARALRDELHAELCAAGYDGSESREAWPVSAWRAVLDLVRRRLFSQLDEAQGFRELGRRFAKGFGQTPVGRVFTLVAPLLGPERGLLTVPKYLHVVRKHLRVDVDQLAAHRWRFVAVDDAFDSAEPPDFLAGCLEGVLLATGVSSRITVVSFDGVRLELDVAW